MRIAYITAGAAGMYCGSCMHDNTLVAALCRLGHEAFLIPTYTPIRTDEPDVSQRRVFFGGINVYLQQKLSIFRYTPWFLDRLLDARALLRWVSRFAVKTEAQELADLTVSMLEGEHGRQRKEVEKVVRWIADELRPDVVILTNALLSGLVHELKRDWRGPVLVMLQGDDIYLESLPEPARSRSLDLIRDHCQEIDGFFATSGYYADFMASYFAVPRARIDVVLPGLNLHGHGGPRPPREGQPFTLGYFARICPEKGLHQLIAGYLRFRQRPGLGPCRLRVAGWLGEHRKPYLAELVQQLAAAGLLAEFEHLDCPDHASKVKFLQSIDVLSVPTTYREPKGLYVLEALANGTPVVQPRHGSFPELIAATGGGLLVEPGDADELASAFHRLHDDPELRANLARQGQQAVRERFHAERMAAETMAVLERYIIGRGA
jgi:glycosyltransferase involved in cell wall biosynthesis